MYEREENAQFSLISYSKERRFRVFQTLPDSWKTKKLLQVLTWFLKLVYYRDYLSKIWRKSKIHDCQPILENYRHWLLNSSLHNTQIFVTGMNALDGLPPASRCKVGSKNVTKFCSGLKRNRNKSNLKLLFFC